MRDGPTGSEEPLNPFSGMDVDQLLTSRVALHGDRPWLIWRGLHGERIELTYGGFLDGVERVAAGLRERGVAPGGRVCMYVDNCPDFVLVWFAILRLGAVMVSINSRAKAPEVADAIGRVRPTLVLTSSVLLPRAEQALETLRSSRVDGGWSAAVGVLLADLSTEVAAPEGRDGVTTLLAGRDRHRSDPVRSLAPAGIQFTSGTTARPKGVVWTQANYLWGAKVSAAHEHLGADDRHLVHLPLFHTNAQIYSVMAALWAGGSIVVVPRFSASRFWPVVVEERVTWCSMVPFTVKALRRQPVPAHRMRAFGNAVWVPGWDRYFGVTTTPWWGMTETVSHPIVGDPGFEGRPLAMGRAATEYQVRVRADDGSFPAQGRGSLEVRGIRGVSLALGYLDDPDATAATWAADGWMQTGDRVEAHDDGEISFIEREGDMLKVGGENVAALEIERTIGAVRGVEEVAVVALADPLRDEVPVAFVLVRADLPSAEHAQLRQTILDACHRDLADFKVPKAVHVVAELPRVTLEKVAKAELRKQAQALHNNGG